MQIPLKLKEKAFVEAINESICLIPLKNNGSEKCEPLMGLFQFTDQNFPFNSKSVEFA